MIIRVTYYSGKLIIALVIACCACRETPDNRLVIPSDYTGKSVAIIFNHASGSLVEQVNGGYTFLIPEDGVLKLSNDFLDSELIIVDPDGNPIWNDGNVKTFTATSLCANFSTETLFIYRSNLIALDSVALTFKYDDACK